MVYFSTFWKCPAPVTAFVPFFLRVYIKSHLNKQNFTNSKRCGIWVILGEFYALSVLLFASCLVIVVSLFAGKRAALLGRTSVVAWKQSDLIWSQHIYSISIMSLSRGARGKQTHGGVCLIQHKPPRQIKTCFMYLILSRASISYQSMKSRPYSRAPHVSGHTSADGEKLQEYCSDALSQIQRLRSVTLSQIVLLK